MYVTRAQGFILAFIVVITLLEMSTSVYGKSSLQAYLNKKYKLEYVDDKFEEVMKILGVGFMKRKLGNVARPVMELKEKDGEYTLTSESVFKNIETKFKLGEEFQEETADGRTVTSIFTQDGDTLTQVQRGDKTTTITREFSPDQVKVMVEVDGVNSTRIYKAV